MKRHSDIDIEKLSSDKRLAWRALSTIVRAPPPWIPPFLWRRSRRQSVCRRHGSRVSIPNGHTLPRGHGSVGMLLIMRISALLL